MVALGPQEVVSSFLLILSYMGIVPLLQVVVGCSSMPMEQSKHPKLEDPIAALPINSKYVSSNSVYPLACMLAHETD